MLFSGFLICAQHISPTSADNETTILGG